MAGMALLEREIEKRSGELSPQNTAATLEEQEHQRAMAENMRKLLDPAEDTRFDRFTPPANPAVRTYDFDGAVSERAPAYQNPMSIGEYHAPAVPNAPDAPSAAQRLADYVPVKVGMTSVQRFADMPESYAAPAAAPEAPEKRALFENLTYRNGEVLEDSAPVEAPDLGYAEAPVYSPSYMPESVPYTADADEDDALPTRRTMDTLRRIEEDAKEENSSFLSALSLKTKLVLAAVGAVIVLLLAAICVNTAILNSLNSEVGTRKEELIRLTDQMEGIDAEIDRLTSEDFIAKWAAEHGMIR